jgi:hypothetical protein
MTIFRPALLAFAALCASPALAQDLTDEQVGRAADFALNNSVFVLQHEIGHLLIAEFQLPVLGKEEDAADSMASITLLARQTPEAQVALSDSADGWLLSENSKAGTEYEEADFYDEHSLDIQRSFQIVCYMVGADPETFGEVAEAYQMDSDRQDGCGFDYQQATDSWGSLLQPHEGKGGGKIAVSYEPASEDYADIEAMLQDAKLLETAAEEIETTYDLPRDLQFTAKECGEENAFYSYDDAGITFCYEMTAFFFDLAAQDLTSEEPNIN